MTDIVLDEIGSGYNLSKMNDNFQKIETSLNEYKLSTTGGNNTMQQALDMNNQRILNLGEPKSPTDPLRLGDVERINNTAVGANIVTQTAAEVPTTGVLNGVKWYIIDTAQTFVYVVENGKTVGQWVEEDQLGDDVDVTAASYLTVAQAQSVDVEVGQYFRFIDREEGLFRVNPVGTVADGYGVVSHPSGMTFDVRPENGKWNARHFGTDGTGIVDDTNALRSLFSRGGTLVCPDVYLLSNTIFIPENAVLEGTRSQTVFLRAPGFTGAMFVVRSNNTIKGAIFNGQATEAGAGDSLSIDGKTGVKLEDLGFINSPNDGILCRNSSGLTFKHISTLNNYRNGISITDNVQNVTLAHIRSTNDAVAGIDIEPNTTVSERIRLHDVVVSGTLLSIQGGGSVNYSKYVSGSQIQILNGGTLNINRTDQLSLDNIYISDDSNIIVDNQQTANSYGQTNGTLLGTYGDLPNVGYSRVLNGDFQNGGANWTIVKTGGSDVAEVIDGEGLYGTHEAHLSNATPSNTSFYVSDQFKVAGSQQVVVGGVIRPVSGRPYILIQFRNGATVLKEYKTAPNFYNPEYGKAKNYFMAMRAPATADNARVFIGCGNGEQSEGYFDGIFVHVNSIKTSL